MTLNRQIVRTLFVTELRMVLRDRRILLTSILLPVLIMPLMLAGSHWTVKRRQMKLHEATYRFATSGPESELVRSFISERNKQLPSPVSPNRKDEFPRVPDSTNVNSGTRGRSSFQARNASPQPKFEEIKADDPLQALQDDKVDIVLEAAQPELSRPETNSFSTKSVSSATADETKAAKSRSARQRNRQFSDDDAEHPVSGAPLVRIIYRGDRDLSSTAATRAREVLQETRRTRRADLLKGANFAIEPREVGPVVTNDVASKRYVSGLALGRTLTLLLVFLILTSGSVVATDSIAGEKERGTLETLLSTSARRVEIITSKMLVILVVALTITLIQSANLLLYIGLKLVPVSSNFAASVSAPIALLLFLLFLPVAALAASVLLLISGRANSYKEAQMFFFPVFLIGLVPATAPLFPALSLHSLMALVPVANLALSVREILIGNYDWPFVILSWLVTLAAVACTSSLAVRSLSAERLVTGGEAEALDPLTSPVLFSRHVLRWFAVLWAILLIVNNYLEKADMRLQIIINLVVLFFGASSLMLWRYRLNVRETLSLRWPRPAVWLGVIAAVPSGLITASGLFRLLNYFIPVSSKLAQQFDEAIFPQNVSLWQLLFFLSVMPGIVEEIAFRGLLLSGLRRRFRPVVTAVLVGTIFGLFHVAIFRFAPTALLGIMLAAVVLLTRSIFPAMLWHASSNAISVYAAKQQLPLTELAPSSYLIATIMLALAFWIFWRNRRFESGSS